MSMTTVKTAEATGKSLDWLVWYVERDMDEPPKPKAGIRVNIPAYSTDWGTGGPLLDKYNILFDIKARALPPYDRLYAYRVGQPEGAMPGPDRLVATCRALAWAFFGDTAQVPSDLLDANPAA